MPGADLNGSASKITLFEYLIGGMRVLPAAEGCARSARGLARSVLFPFYPCRGSLLFSAAGDMAGGFATLGIGTRSPLFVQTTTDYENLAASIARECGVISMLVFVITVVLWIFL